MRQGWPGPYEAPDAAAFLAVLPATAIPTVQELADKNYALLKSDPHHPSLHFKKIGGAKQLWSVRVGENYQA